MLLEDLLKGLDYKLINGDLKTNVKEIRYDNRKVTSGDLFVCIKGFKVDGHEFAKSAIDNGATVIIAEKKLDINHGITEVLVEDSRKALAVISSNYYDNPSSKMKIIGVTGTNGKTTTAFMLKSILDKAGHKTGLVGTIANYIGNKVIKTERTTPESFELQKLFKEMVDEEVEYCIMEVSSHSLELNRVYGVEFYIGIFTNLTRDHLDFHLTFDNYYKAKYKLFQNSKFKVVNMDDEYGQRVKRDLISEGSEGNIITYSINNSGDFDARNISVNGILSNFNVIYKEDSKDMVLQIPGDYNIYNALGAIASARILDITWENIINALKETVVAGRCERVALEYPNDYEIIIDYAHTPDGLENILKTARKFTNNKLICIFGCGGDRDKQKRGEMGQIAVELADYSIITSDNPRTEDPLLIINDIVKELKKNNYEVEENRHAAIEKGMKMAKDGDVLILAGKGHETYQVLKEKTIDFDERKIIKEILAKI